VDNCAKCAFSAVKSSRRDCLLTLATKPGPGGLNLPGEEFLKVSCARRLACRAGVLPFIR
jgi:hypothetical protein